MHLHPVEVTNEMLLHLLVDRPEGAAHQYSVNSINNGILFWNIHTLHGAFVLANLVLIPDLHGKPDYDKLANPPILSFDP